LVIFVPKIFEVGGNLAQSSKRIILHTVFSTTM